MYFSNFCWFLPHFATLDLLLQNLHQQICRLLRQAANVTCIIHTWIDTYLKLPVLDLFRVETLKISKIFILVNLKRKFSFNVSPFSRIHSPNTNVVISLLWDWEYMYVFQRGEIMWHWNWKMPPILFDKMCMHKGCEDTYVR